MDNFDLFENKKESNRDIEGPVYSVSELTARIKSLLIRNFGLETFWIKGEISNYRGRNAQGHIYFRLKDENAIISAAFFSYLNKKLSFDLEEGMQVLLRGKIGLYEPSGSYQIIVEEVKPSGVGELFLKFEQLKKKLEAEGLFDEKRKRKLPYIPQRIGIITSPTGSVIKDMLKILKNRLPSIPVTIFPARVQGKDAKYDIVNAIKLAGKKKFAIDLIILGRGGGSLEELWPFNEEIVARAVAKSKIPIISAVGHETDYTISDFTADLRASTPSNAIELAVPDRSDLEHRVNVLISDIISTISEKIELYGERIKGFQRSAVLKDPMSILRNRQQLLDELIEKGFTLIRFKTERALNSFNIIKESFVNILKGALKDHVSRVNLLKEKLQTLNPTAILGRGYSIARDSKGKIIKSIKNVSVKDFVALTLSDGNLGLTVKEKTKK